MLFLISDRAGVDVRGVMSSVLLILVNNNPLIVMHWTSGQKLNIIRITRDSAGKHSSTIIPDSPDTNQMFHTFQRQHPHLLLQTEGLQVVVSLVVFAVEV